MKWEKEKMEEEIKAVVDKIILVNGKGAGPITFRGVCELATIVSLEILSRVDRISKGGM